MDLISASSPPSLVSHPVLSAISVEELDQRFPLVKRALFPAQILNTLCLKKDPKRWTVVRGPLPHGGSGV